MKILEICENLFRHPTAPFREGFILNAIEDILATHGIPHAYDRFGNLYAGWNFKGKCRAKLGLMAHTDHPGFHVTKQLSLRRLQAIWLGGGPPELVGARVRVFSPESERSVLGTLTKCRANKPGKKGRFLIDISLDVPADRTLVKQGAFGSFDFPPVRVRGNHLYTRAADDLAGCALQLAALIDTRETNPAELLAVFTRAEEVGFVGCLASLQAKDLPRIPFVSIEASSQRKQARVGDGFILRLGDYSSLFDHSLSQNMWESARRIKGLSYQRRIMDGGSCEATALIAKGFQVSGLSLPLGNYHNENKMGRPAAEYISLQDLEGARIFLKSWIQEFRSSSQIHNKRLEANYKLYASELSLKNLKRFQRSNK